MKHKTCILSLTLITLGMSLTTLEAQNTPFYSVKDYGAVADGQTKDTEAIAKAIDAASQAGGGTIYFQSGTYLTGPIHLKSNITLYVDAGATVKFSTDYADYVPMVKSRWEGLECMNFSPQIYAYQAENITITGQGIIDGQGHAWWFMDRSDPNKIAPWSKVFEALNKDSVAYHYFQRRKFFLRPPMIQPVDCQRVRIEGVKLQNSPFWTCNPIYCDDLTVHNVTIINPEHSPNTDGINPDSCSNVHISNCHISVGDDCITIKSGRDEDGRRVGRPCENITITNCTMLNGNGGVVIGSEMSGDVRKVTISNCVFDGTDRGIRIKTTRGRGGVVEDVRVSNIVMSRIPRAPFNLNMFYSSAPEEPISERTPTLRNIHFSDIIVKDCPKAGFILGLPERPAENITFNNIQIEAKTGFVCKDAHGIEFHHVRVDTQKGPALQCEQVCDLEIEAFKTLKPHEDAPVIALTNVQDAYVHACRATAGTGTFLSLEGSKTEAVLMQGNALGRARQAVACKDECTKALTLD